MRAPTERRLCGSAACPRTRFKDGAAGLVTVAVSRELARTPLPYPGARTPAVHCAPPHADAGSFPSHLFQLELVRHCGPCQKLHPRDAVVFELQL